MKIKHAVTWASLLLLLALTEEIIEWSGGRYSFRLELTGRAELLFPEDKLP